MVIIKSHDEFESHLGKEIGVSNWHQITLEQINQFADATLDHQWIHTDPERAKSRKSLQDYHCAWLPYTLPDTLFLETGCRCADPEDGSCLEK